MTVAMFSSVVTATVVVTLGLPQSAGARRVILRPSLVSECQRAASWDAMQVCVRRFGVMTMLRSSADMRLVRVTTDGDDLGVSGQYLFVRHGRRWQLGASIRGEYEVKSITRPTFDGQQVIRIDIAHALRHEIVIADGVSHPAWYSARMSVFCDGTSAACEQVVTSCDLIVRGKTFNRFRGTLAYEQAGSMRVVGDRTLAGTNCEQPERVFIPLPGPLLDRVRRP